MSTIKHNKRNNVGLLYEFLIRSISSAVVENDEKRSNAALNIIKRHFKSGTDLYREFRLINSLVKTTVSNQSIAASIINEAKVSVRETRASNIDKERARLISSIDRELNDPDFYDRHVETYRAYATAQSLINEWRKPIASNLTALARYEDTLCEWLAAEKPTPNVNIPESDAPGADRLIMQIMTKKLNEKYGSALSSTQKQLIKSYVFADAKNDNSIIKTRLLSIKERLEDAIGHYTDQHKDDKYVNEKLKSVRDSILLENLGPPDDSTLTRFMLYSKMIDELESSE